MPAPESQPPPGDEPLKGWMPAMLDALRGVEHDYTSGSIGRAIALLAIPMVLELTMESVFSICDVYFVSRLGDSAVATVGLTETMLTIAYALGIGVGTAATAVVARRIGEKNPAGARRAASQAVLTGVFLGAAVGIPGALFAGDLLALMGAEADVVETGGGYTATILGSSAVIFLLFLNNAVLRGAGDAAQAMRVLWLANGINLVLDPCLIFGLGPFPEMGVTGAAVATAIGRGTGVLYQLALLARGRGRICLRFADLRLRPAVMRSLLRLSVGGVLQLLIATASWIILMRIVAHFGKSAVAGYAIAIRIVVFALLPAWGLSNAAATLVGQNLGAGRPERAERSVWMTGWANAGFLALVMVAFLLFGDDLVGLFTEEAETRGHGADALRIMSYGYVFYGWGMVVTSAFNGAGDTMTPTRLNLICFWMVQVPLAWVLARGVGLGPSGVFWAVAVAESLLAVVSMVVFRWGAWKEKRLAPDVEGDGAAAGDDAGSGKG